MLKFPSSRAISLLALVTMLSGFGSPAHAGQASSAASAAPAPIAALAAEQPAIGDPVDHFASRRPIGEQGIFTFGGDVDEAANGRLFEVAYEKKAPPADPDAGPDDPSPEPVTVNPPRNGSIQQTTARLNISNGAMGAVQADLIPIKTADGRTRPSLQPGLLVATENSSSAPGCASARFCLHLHQLKHDRDRNVTGFGDLAVELGDANPTKGTDVAVASGTFNQGQGPSAVVAWIHRPASPVDGSPLPPLVKFAHVVVDVAGDGTPSLKLDGDVQTLGEAYNDPTRGPTSPSIAVGDFDGDGTDQAAVVWGAPRVSSNQPRITVAVLGAGPDAGLRNAAPSLTLSPPVESSTPPQGVSSGQVGPGAVAQHDVRDDDSVVDHLIVGPGVSTSSLLYRIDVGDQLSSTSLSGPAKTVAHERYRTANSKLESLGDLDGDGLDEILATPFAQFNSYSAAYRANSFECTDILAGLAVGPSPICGRVEILDFASDYPDLGEGFTVDTTKMAPGTIESAVFDGRTTQDQRIAPRLGVVDAASLPQVGITHGSGSIFQRDSGIDIVSITSDEGFSDAGGKLISKAPASGGRQPRLVGVALDGQVELGEPVQDGYRSLEPSVILNAPPTHFDVFGETAYDPNFCYAGNQYAVPPVCFFDSEYERASSTSTEVETNATEDWAVSSKLNAEAEFGVVSLQAELRAGYGENFSKTDALTETEQVTVNVKARNTDKIYAINRAYDTLEYPLYQPGNPQPEYLLTTTPHTVSQRWIDSSSPAALSLGVNHQPGNILSYPEDLSTAENPFISPTQGTDSVTKTTFGRDEFELSDSSDYTYRLTKSKVDADSAATTKRWNVGATLSGGTDIGVVSIDAEVSGDYSRSDLTNISTTIGDDTNLVSTMAGIDESFGETAYTVKPFAYWTDSAALVLDYAVEPSVSATGAPKTWWQQKYGAKPDLTMFLPRLLDFEKQAGISSDAARFISPSVEVFKGGCDNPSPIGNTRPAVGAPLCLSTQVENYSLKNGTTNTRVDFFDADPQLGGNLLGSTIVPPVGARDRAMAKINWTPDERFSGTTPRIFARVDAADEVTEIHEDNNLGFRSFATAPSGIPALHPAEDVYAEVGPNDDTLEVSWETPDDLAPHQWLVNAYPDDGGAPTGITVDGDKTAASMTVPMSGTYRVVLFAISGEKSSAASHPAEPLEVKGTDPAPDPGPDPDPGPGPNPAPGPDPITTTPDPGATPTDGEVDADVDATFRQMGNKAKFTVSCRKACKARVRGKAVVKLPRNDGSRVQMKLRMRGQTKSIDAGTSRVLVLRSADKASARQFATALKKGNRVWVRARVKIRETKGDSVVLKRTIWMVERTR